jgi:hypothetical protein
MGATERSTAFMKACGQFLHTLEESTRAQFRWSVNCDYRDELLSYKRITDEGSEPNSWAAITRNERFNRYWQAMQSAQASLASGQGKSPSAFSEGPPGRARRRPPHRAQRLTSSTPARSKTGPVIAMRRLLVFEVLHDEREPSVLLGMTRAGKSAGWNYHPSQPMHFPSGLS